MLLSSYRISRLFSDCGGSDGFAKCNLSKVMKRYLHDNEKTYLNGKYSLHDIKGQFQKLTGGRITLRKDETSGIAFIGIDHVDKKNGLSGKMMVDLNDIVGDLETWKPGKGVILYGHGGTFCSGGYLNTVKRISNPEDGYKMATLMHDSVLRLRTLPLVSASVITGKAIGGGAELILATDYRLMSPASEIRYVEAKMGVGTGWGGGTLLQRLVGHRTALDLLLTCRKISPDEALVLGLADEIIEEKDGDDDSAVLERAVEWLQQRLSGHHSSVIQTVKSIVVSNNFEEERIRFSETWGGVAQQEALRKNIKHK